MNFSRPLNTEQTGVYSDSQSPEMSPRPSLRHSSAQLDRQSVAESFSDPSVRVHSASVLDPRATLREPLDQPGTNQAELGDMSGRVGSRPRIQRYYNSLPSPKEEDEEEEDGEVHSPLAYDMPSFMKQPLPQKEAKKARYYSYKLSEEDKQALAIGEKNHNLKKWTPKDLVRYHESRAELVPRGLDEENEVLVQINMDKSRSEQYLIKEEKQASQSMYDLPVSTAPSATPLSPTSPTFLGRSSTFPSRPVHVRNTNSGDYFGAQLHSRQASTNSSQASHSSIRNRNLLVTEARPFEPSPNITFDSFLSPHATGKGEAYRGSQNAKKYNVPGSEKQDGLELKDLRKRPGRLSKMPSMPSLRKRKSKGNAANSPLSR